MTCILRIGGFNLNIGNLIEIFPIKPFRVDSEENLISKDGGINNRPAELHFIIDDRDFASFEEQCDAVNLYLKKYKTAICLATNFQNVDFAEIDFGVIVAEKTMFSERFSSSFLRILADCGLSSCISHYVSPPA
jgi:hypothetical protein